MVLRNVTVNDRDASIKYQGSWNHTRVGVNYKDPSISQSRNITATQSLKSGDNFTIVTPPILAFYYFGIPFAIPLLNRICIDCDPNNPTWEDIKLNNFTALTETEPSVIIYSKSWEDAEGHEIIVANEYKDGQDGVHTPFYVDKLVYTVDVGSDPSTTPSKTGSESIYTSWICCV